jgi:dihydrolipoamide dehydrogenase
LKIELNYCFFMFTPWMRHFLYKRRSWYIYFLCRVSSFPSKALLQVAAVMDEVSHLGALGIEFGVPKVNVDTLRCYKDKVIGKLIGGFAAMAKMPKVTVVRGYCSFVGAYHLSVEETSGTAQEKTGKTQTIAFKKAIIAAGSQAVSLRFMPNDSRLVDSTGALALKEVPKRMLLLGVDVVGTHAGDMIGEIALATEMGADVVGIGKAAEVAHGSCTDLPPVRN